MDVKGEVLLQLFNNSKLRNGTKTFLEPKFFLFVKFKKLGFSDPLSDFNWNHLYCVPVGGIEPPFVANVKSYLVTFMRILQNLERLDYFSNAFN